MIVLRLLTLLLCILPVGLAHSLAASGPRASAAAAAAAPPVWQPYGQRQVARPRTPQRVTPVQYTHVMPHEQDRAAAVFAGSPLSVDCITDADLDRLSGIQYDPPYATPGPFIDPIIANSTNRLRWSSPPSNGHVAPGELELLPGDLIWHSYWAGAKEPRTSGALFRESNGNVSLLDVSLGGRTSILRNATRDDRGLWQGWEMQIEGAAILRLNLDERWDFDSADFRFGVPFILARQQMHWKLAYYHLSSHVGDEFLVRNPGFTRVNFSRDVLVLGGSYFPQPAWRWYAELGWAFHDDDGSEPWETQFGVDYAQPGPTGSRGTPFFAVNGHLREESDFGGNLSLQAGWLWRGQAGRMVRTGLHYYNGKSSQFEFFDNFEQQIGVGLWQEY